MSSECRVNTNQFVISAIFLIFLVVHGLCETSSPSKQAFEEDMGFDMREDDMASLKLVLSNIIYRHGDRTPVDPYPLDPYKNLSYWPAGWGQLTNRGKEQHYELGKWLRTRYQTLLPNAYSNEDIVVRSTDVDRTLMSAESNLAGLYPPESSQEWNPDVKWQPIPVHTVPEQMDELLAAKRPCARYDAALERAKNSPAIQEINRKYGPLYQYLTEHTGRDVSDVTGVEYIHNTLYIEALYNLTLPEWTKSVYPAKTLPVAGLSFTLPAFNSELQRLKSGPLLGEIVHHMKQKIDKKLSPDRKLFIYSGHDTTVANMLMTLNVFEPHCPPYTGTILLELWQKNQNFFVTVMYRNSTGKPLVLTVPGCDTICPLKRFLMITEPVIPINWSVECEMSGFFEPDLVFGDYSIVLIGVILLGVFLITLSMCIVMTLFYFRKNKVHIRYQRLSTSPHDGFQGA